MFGTTSGISCPDRSICEIVPPEIASSRTSSPDICRSVTQPLRTTIIEQPEQTVGSSNPRNGWLDPVAGSTASIVSTGTAAPAELGKRHCPASEPVFRDRSNVDRPRPLVDTQTEPVGGK